MWEFVRNVILRPDPGFTDSETPQVGPSSLHFGKPSRKLRCAALEDFKVM